MDTQLKRGMLEACVLAALYGGESYGYKIIKDVGPYIEISESTLYPVLKRLETSGWVSGRTAEHAGRLRKYYCITPSGRSRTVEFLGDWKEVMTVYGFIKDRTEGETI